MAKARVRVVVKTGRKGDASKLVAKIPIAVTKSDKPKGQAIYRTKAQIGVHIYKSNGQQRQGSRY